MSAQSGQRLVVFGCGYVGAAVALEGLVRGWQVTALTRNAAKARLLREEGIEAIVADLAATDWHAQISGEVHFALNCVSSGGGGVEGYRHSYLQGMESIATWARLNGRVGTMVYTGSTSVYPHDGGVVVDELAPTTSATNERAQVLLAAEARLREASGAWGRWFILRLAGIYGPGRHHLLDQVRTREVAGLGTHHLNLIHRDDIVRATMACFTAPEGVKDEILNLADDHPARKHEIVAWLAGKLGLPEPRFTGEPAGGRRVVTPDRIISNARSKAVLGWAPRYPSYREGYEMLGLSQQPKAGDKAAEGV
ncbi:MAG: NAD-dependent epimerase/dehydratase family protein [Verrucomicrobiota bacterium]